MVGQPHQGISNSAVDPANRIDGESKENNNEPNLNRMLRFIEGPLLFHRKRCYFPIRHSGTVYTNNISQPLHTEHCKNCLCPESGMTM